MQNAEHFLATCEGLYPAIPKYFFGEPQRINGRFLEPLEREFEFNGKMYQVRITPARIKDKDGIERDYYLGEREELVEDALIHLAGEMEGEGFEFSLESLRRELARYDHHYSTDEIRTALMICQNSRIELVRIEDGAQYVFSVFEELRLPEQ